MEGIRDFISIWNVMVEHACVCVCVCVCMFGENDFLLKETMLSLVCPLFAVSCSRHFPEGCLSED